MRNILAILLLGVALAQTFDESLDNNCTTAYASTEELQGCSGGWRITGYYVPNEADFRGPKIPLTVKGRTYRLKKSFVRAVRMEGDGKTEEGWILNCCPWSRATKIIGSCNRELHTLRAVARDPKLMRCGTPLQIKTPILSGKTFLALDTGGAIRGKHLDVFCGFGQKGKALSHKVTTNGATVCIR
eukprot:TRINITY_DN5433_c0_g1_i5.p1 TRINITY_DN5433_c0_g1~~TRINITY_DN5433_c0_g1_i5.p1  ORF type:complete len:186 (-),score=25.84 TRINITY_DN5433_c0_g1_i5:190-747(-)